MGEKELSFWHNLTEGHEKAKTVWEDVVYEIQKVGREDILNNPAVLDIGGGMGEFYKYLNQQGIRSISLDNQDLTVDKEANPVRASAYQMPFADASFDIVHGRGVFDDSLYPHDFPKLLTEIARVLKPHGILSVFDFTPPPTSEFEKLFKRLSKTDKDYPTLWEKK